MEGGARILAYEIAVLLVSLPFITFLTWRARVLGLKRRNAFIITVYLCGNVMLFPWALRLGWTYWWILAIIVLFISAVLWPKLLRDKSKHSEKVETNSKEEAIEAIKASVFVPDPLSVEDLIDLGFQEKQSENFRQAAVYFIHALSQNPPPDLAFYLIIDCYWLWNKLGERDYALTELQTYTQMYLPLFSPELRFQFDTWRVKEDFQIS